jgi:hypothetical protein
MNTIPKQPAKVMQVTGNKKTGPMSGTYAPIEQSCPDSCPFKQGIVTREGKRIYCYAEIGRVGKSNLECEDEAFLKTPVEIAKVEAKGIDLLKAYGQPLRLHISGDARTNAAASHLANASKRFVNRGGGPPFTYSHAWKDVKRASWGIVSVLASLHKPEDSKLATKRGYACSIVVDDFPNNEKAFSLPGSEIDWIPCPQQTERSETCLSCRLCFDDQKLRKGKKGIAFKKHTPNDKKKQGG